MTQHWQRSTHGIASVVLATIAALGSCMTTLAVQAAPGIPVVALRTSGGLFDPEAAALPSWEGDGESASVVRRDGGLALHIEGGGRPGLRAALPEEMLQATGVFRSGQKLVVTGWMNGALAGVVAIVDARTAQIVDRFWGYAVSVSPDAAAVAFVRFHPSYLVTGSESQYRVYRTARSPAENRLDLPAGWATGERHVPLRDVGQALYPLKRDERWRDNVEVPDALAHQRLSPLSWSADGRRLAFLDRQGESVSVVVAEWAGESTAHRVSVKAAVLADYSTLCTDRMTTAANCAHLPAEAMGFEWRTDALTVTAMTGGGSATHSLRVPQTLLRPVAE